MRKDGKGQDASHFGCGRLALTLILSFVSANAALGQAFDALVFSKTAGFRHDSIPQGITMIQQLASANGFTATFTEDSNAFTAGNLAQYELIVFLNTTGDVLNTTQEAAMVSFIQAGKGFVGIHSAADTEYGWTWYGGLVGAYFQDHPPGTPTATVEVADRAHPSSASLPKYWTRTDEWYNFQTNPRNNVHVLATVDESTYSGGTMGHDHPHMWCQEYDGGRSWYIGGGHTQASYSETNFRNAVLNGMKWAAGVIGGDGEASIPANYQRVLLSNNAQSEVIAMSIAPDGRVFYTERAGRLMIYKPSTQTTVVAGSIPVFSSLEDGFLGVEHDPNFATNGFIYIYYAPPSGSANRLSRFTMSGDTLLTASEVVLLTVATQRNVCCHSAGSVEFGNNGQLFLSTGDNTQPWESDGYTPIDERPGRSDWDAQKSSGNRNDLRGKILRIVPQSNGTYTIPAGNLFPSNGSNGRAEVYCMGVRNPFRMSVDPETGWVYWGDVGPDAGEDSPTRGPKGYDEFNQARAAGNFGFPYCSGPNQPYGDHNFATGVTGPLFNCAAPVNNSPNNTGSQTLPAAVGAFIWYPYVDSTVFPELNSATIVNRTAMAGPVYHYNAGASSSVKLPQYYDDTLFIWDWSRKIIREVKLDDSGNILKINPFMQTTNWGNVIDAEFAPNGDLYVLEYATSLYRVEYVRGDLSPVAMGSATPDTGVAPLNVQFSSAGSFDPDGTIVAYEWDFTSNGSVDSTSPNPSFSYTSNGNFTAKLTVRDNDSNTAFINIPIIVGNTRPVVTITSPVDGGVFEWDTLVPFTVSVSDAEDGSTGGGQIPCSSVVTEPFIGHDSHAHSSGQSTGCSGGFTTATASGHNATDNLYYVFEARYTDLGGPGAAPLLGTKKHTLQPKQKQAEHYTTASGIIIEGTSDVGGGSNIGAIDHDDYISINPLNLQGITSVTYRVASPTGGGGVIEMRTGSPTGPVVASTTVTPTGGWQTWTSLTTPFTNPGGTHHYYFVFRTNGSAAFYNLNWIKFNGDGITAGHVVSYEPGTTDVANKMTHPQGGDGDTVAATIGGRNARRNVSTAEDYYFMFSVDDNYAFAGNRPTNFVTIEYYDTGTGSLDLQYDASDGNFYKSGGSVTLTNSNTWKTHTYSVTDAYFGNRQNAGADFRIFIGTGVTRHLDLVMVCGNSSQGGQVTYPGTPFPVPGTIQAEQYDRGGQGVAYNDLNFGNSGGQFRTTENVDIEATTDTGGGYNVGFTDVGEWLEYTINVAVAGTYTLNLRVASPNAGMTYHVELNGTNLTGVKSIPNTGGWQTWTTTSAGAYSFTTGQKVLRVYMETGGFNLNYIELVGQQSPFGGTARAIPGVIQAEDFDNGGEATAYHDNDVGNTGGQYRASENVDIEATTDTGGGYNVGWTGAGEWLEYTVNVNTTGDYAIKTRLAAGGAGGTFRYALDGGNITGIKTINTTGGWQNWTTITVPGVALTAGTNKVLRFSVESGDFNLNSIEFTFGGADVVSIDLAGTNLEDGMTSPIGGDGDTISGTIGGHTARRNMDPGFNDHYFYFTVTDGYAFQGNKPSATISVEYYDSGTHTLTLQYDGTPGAYTNGPTIALTNTNTWKTAVLNVSNAYFGNRQNWSSDFRIHVGNIVTHIDTVMVFCAAGGPVTLNNSAFPSNADGWNIVVWKAGPYNNGTMAWQSSNGNPTGNMRSTGDGGSNNTDSCTREGGEINKAVSTAGYNTLVQVVYDVRFETNQTGTACIGSCPVLEGNCADKLAVYYSTSGTAGPWTLLEAVNALSVTQNVWSTRTINCPAAANNKANFAVRFRWQFNQGTDGGRLDNVKVIATP